MLATCTGGLGRAELELAARLMRGGTFAALDDAAVVVGAAAVRALVDSVCLVLGDFGLTRPYLVCGPRSLLPIQCYCLVCCSYFRQRLHLANSFRLLIGLCHIVLAMVVRPRPHMNWS